MSAPESICPFGCAYTCQYCDEAANRPQPLTANQRLAVASVLALAVIWIVSVIGLVVS